jgi:hypothetical protein
VFSVVVPESSAALGGTGEAGGGAGVVVAVGVGEFDGPGVGNGWVGVGVGVALAVAGMGSTVILTVADTGAPPAGATRYVNVSSPTYVGLGV